MHPATHATRAISDTFYCHPRIWPLVRPRPGIGRPGGVAGGDVAQTPLPGIRVGIGRMSPAWPGFATGDLHRRRGRGGMRRMTTRWPAELVEIADRVAASIRAADRVAADLIADGMDAWRAHREAWLAGAGGVEAATAYASLRVAVNWCEECRQPIFDRPAQAVRCQPCADARGRRLARERVRRHRGAV